MIFFKIKQYISKNIIEFIPVIRDGAIFPKEKISNKIIPVLRLDCSRRPDIEEMIAYHVLHPDGGDVSTTWTLIKQPEPHVALSLDFIRPYQTTAMIPFQIREQLILVESILYSKKFCIEAGKPGDTSPMLADDRHRIIIHVPETGFSKNWIKLRDKELFKFYRSKGMNRYRAREAASDRVDKAHKVMKLNDGRFWNGTTS